MITVELENNQVRILELLNSHTLNLVITPVKTSNISSRSLICISPM